MNVMTKRRQRHSPEQIVRKIQDADRILAEGGDVAAVVRQLNVTEATYYQWRLSKRLDLKQGAGQGDSRSRGATPSPPPSRTGGVLWSAVCANCEGLPLTLQHRATHTPPGISPEWVHSS
jgi:hypothetical protein